MGGKLYRASLGDFTFKQAFIVLTYIADEFQANKEQIEYLDMVLGNIALKKRQEVLEMVYGDEADEKGL